MNSASKHLMLQKALILGTGLVLYKEWLLDAPRPVSDIAQLQPTEVS